MRVLVNEIFCFQKCRKYTFLNNTIVHCICWMFWKILRVLKIFWLRLSKKQLYIVKRWLKRYSVSNKTRCRSYTIKWSVPNSGVWLRNKWTSLLFENTCLGQVYIFFITSRSIGRCLWRKTESKQERGNPKHLLLNPGHLPRTCPCTTTRLSTPHHSTCPTPRHPYPQCPLKAPMTSPSIGQNRFKVSRHIGTLPSCLPTTVRFLLSLFIWSDSIVCLKYKCT